MYRVGGSYPNLPYPPLTLIFPHPNASPPHLRTLKALIITFASLALFCLLLLLVVVALVLGGRHFERERVQSSAWVRGQWVRCSALTFTLIPTITLI